MKKSDPQIKIDVLQCITIGINTKNGIFNNVQCKSGTLNKALAALVEDGKIKFEKHGTANWYFLSNIVPYHDPFGLAQPNKNTNTFYLPPRRQHSLDGKRLEP